MSLSWSAWFKTVGIGLILMLAASAVSWVVTLATPPLVTNLLMLGRWGVCNLLGLAGVGALYAFLNRKSGSYRTSITAFGGGLAAGCVGGFGVVFDLIVLIVSNVWNAAVVDITLWKVVSDSPLLPVIVITGMCLCGLVLVGALLGAGSAAVFATYLRKKRLSQ